jgi:glycosyltransferase involved in cell wall biosynthesis
MPRLRLVTVSPPPHVERALVQPGGEPPPALPALRDAFARLFDAVRKDGQDVVSQHAFDAEAVELAAGLPVLHTLHLPPIVPAMVHAVRTSEAQFVTVSEAMRRAWAMPRLGVIRNGVPAFELTEGAVARRALIVGRVSPEKGTANALRMARRAGLTPLLVGTVYNRTYWAEEVGLPVSSVERKQLWRLMAASAVTLMPVQGEESFGMVAAESQMAGCPVVAYRRGGLPEVIGEGVGGFLVEPGDEDAFVAKILSALALDRVRIRESALDRLDIAKSAAAYEKVLSALQIKLPYSRSKHSASPHSSTSMMRPGS